MLTALLLLACSAADAPYTARLLAQADLPAATINRAELAAERGRLVEGMPSLGFPITMMSIGGAGTFLFSAVFASLASDWYGIGVGPAVVLSVLIAASVGVAVIGVVALVGRLTKRTETNARLKVIEQQIGPARPGDEVAPPPGPPPPPPGPDQGPPGPPPPPPPPLAMTTLVTF
jgi:hypothetical protein